MTFNEHVWSMGSLLPLLGEGKTSRVTDLLQKFLCVEWYAKMIMILRCNDLKGGCHSLFQGTFPVFTF